MTGSIEQRGRHQVFEVIQIVKVVCLKMCPSIKASVVSILKEPSSEIPTTGVELPRRSEDVQEYTLHCLFCLAVIPQYCSRSVEHQRTVPLEQDCERVITSRGQRLHEIRVRKCSKA